MSFKLLLSRPSLSDLLFLKISVINTRRPFVEFMERPEIVKEEGWFGFEQEYWMTDRDGIPLGWQLDKEFCQKG